MWRAEKDVASRQRRINVRRMSDFRKLLVWRKGHALVLNVHRTTVKMRKGEIAALRGQMMRAAMSIPTNVVEGNGQETPKEFARFVRFSLNSSSELEYHLILAKDLRGISQADFDSLSGPNDRSETDALWVTKKTGTVVG